MQDVDGTVISYTYVAGGNRISKATGSDITWYVRDEQGNMLSVLPVPPPEQEVVAGYVGVKTLCDLLQISRQTIANWAQRCSH